MRIGFLTLLLVFACSSHPDRGPASVEDDFVFGEVEAAKSTVKQFPPEIQHGLFRHYFYLELKNPEGAFVDCDPEEIELRTSRGKNVEFGFKRLLRGRYYIILEGQERAAHRQLNFFVRGRSLKEKFTLFLRRAVKSRSWIKKVSHNDRKVRLRLFLGDEKGRAVEIPSTPEFLIEGNSHVNGLEHVGEGLWEFDLAVPEENAIIYLSVRAHGTFLERMYRLQHIEK